MKGDDPVLEKTDIYSIGALMYQLITFECPWNHDDNLKAIRQSGGGGYQAETKRIIRGLVRKIIHFFSFYCEDIRLIKAHQVPRSKYITCSPTMFHNLKEKAFQMH